MTKVSAALLSRKLLLMLERQRTEFVAADQNNQNHQIHHNQNLLPATQC